MLTTLFKLINNEIKHKEEMSMRLLGWPKVIGTSILYIRGPKINQKSIVKNINKQKTGRDFTTLLMLSESTDPKSSRPPERDQTPFSI